ncbi:MAG: hypothetical protein GF320_22745 [Armatimonadia bacterium]|nr:hypothetical protein [Armatimonadia bacterium]
MATKIVIPDAGQTTDEMLMGQWLVAEGDEVEVGDALAEIETDKAVAELESYASGTVLKILAEEGDSVSVGQVVVWLGEPGERIPEEAEPERAVDEAAPASAEEAPAIASPAGSDVLASPAARVKARGMGVDLSAIAGSGPGGCVLRRDVIAASGGHAAGTVVPLSPMRRAIADRLTTSAQQAPHFHVAMDVGMTAALDAREAADGMVTLNDLFVKAAADALAQHPGINCQLRGDELHLLDEVNVGIAVGTKDGLLVPVLAGADSLSLPEVATRTRELIEAARRGRVPAGQPATFTVSNLGAYGVKQFTAIINPPESAILAVGAVEDRLALTPAGIVAVATVTLTLSSDHRVIDGVAAAEFLRTIKDRLEAATEWL